MAQLPQNEAIVNALRTAVKLLPEDTIREVLANALIHQNLQMGGAAPMVENYENRVEISNPGEPIVPVERFIDGYQSRNERMAGLMRRMHICEEKSSGVDRVVHTAEIYQLPAPDFRVAHKRTVVTVYGPKPFDEMGRDDRVRACYQHCALKWVISERMTNQSLRERFGLPESKAGRNSRRASFVSRPTGGPAHDNDPAPTIVPSPVNDSASLCSVATRTAPGNRHRRLAYRQPSTSNLRLNPVLAPLVRPSGFVSRDAQLKDY
jgi:hypothetical protein